MNQHQLKSRVHELQRSLADYSTGNRDLLFNARDSIRAASTDLSSSAYKHLEPLLESVEKLIDEVLRHGSLSEDKAIALGAKLTGFAADALGQAAPAVQMGTPGLTGAKLELGKPSTTLPSVIHREMPSGGSEPAPPLPGHGHESVDPNAAQPTAAPTGTAGPEVDTEAVRRSGSSVKYSLDLVNESRLGVILVRTGRITAEDLERALAEQKLHPDRLGSVLVSMGIIQEHEVAEALGDQRDATLRLADGLLGQDLFSPDAGDDDSDSRYGDFPAAS